MWPGTETGRDPSSGSPLRVAKGGHGEGEKVERLDSHLAHSLGETARNIFRSSLNREERKGRKEDEDYALFFIQVTALSISTGTVMQKKWHV